MKAYDSSFINCKDHDYVKCTLKPPAGFVQLNPALYRIISARIRLIVCLPLKLNPTEKWQLSETQSDFFRSERQYWRVFRNLNLFGPQLPEQPLLRNSPHYPVEFRCIYICISSKGKQQKIDFQIFRPESKSSKTYISYLYYMLQLAQLLPREESFLLLFRFDNPLESSVEFMKVVI